MFCPGTHVSYLSELGWRSMLERGQPVYRRNRFDVVSSPAGAADGMAGRRRDSSCRSKVGSKVVQIGGNQRSGDPHSHCRIELTRFSAQSRSVLSSNTHLTPT
ncbi:unnamed protein product [Protopolystoma xenopodis]|uniref:Uncharacterized protein n=1 Tax=Protopolystoma xenopodis TaxID=117903 RepID=A0A3S5A567_9PLAT|nr:unnamed protein product [Protopolystoma xenopodis]